MNDKEKLTALLTEFGIEQKEHEYDSAESSYVSYQVGYDKVLGSRGFVTDFEFDHEGKFIQMEIGE